MSGSSQSAQISTIYLLRGLRQLYTVRQVLRMHLSLTRHAPDVHSPLDEKQRCGSCRMRFAAILKAEDLSYQAMLYAGIHRALLAMA